MYNNVHVLYTHTCMHAHAQNTYKNEIFLLEESTEYVSGRMRSIGTPRSTSVSRSCL